MASFKVHLLGAGLAGGGSAVAALSLFGEDGAPLAGAALVAAMVGGLLPDLDHDHAIPTRELFSLLAALLPAILLPPLLARGLSPEWAILGYAASYALIRFALAPLFKKLTVHRGIFHSIPFLLCAGVATALLLRTFSTTSRLFLGGAVALGVLAHLILDELYAVDFTGKRLKKSFGTALKLWAPSRWASLACYAALVLLVSLLLWELSDG